MLEILKNALIQWLAFSELGTDKISVSISITPFLISIMECILGGIILFFLFKIVPPFREINVIIHEYGHYKHLKDAVCPKLGIPCDCFEFGLKNKSLEGKVFHPAYEMLASKNNDIEYQKLIIKNSKAGCLFYCKTISKLFASLALLSAVLFTWYSSFAWLVGGVLLILFEIADYHFAKSPVSDKKITKHPENFKYNPNYDEYSEIYTIKRLK